MAEERSDKAVDRATALAAAKAAAKAAAVCDDEDDAQRRTAVDAIVLRPASPPAESVERRDRRAATLKTRRFLLGICPGYRSGALPPAAYESDIYRRQSAVLHCELQPLAPDEKAKV